MPHRFTLEHLLARLRKERRTSSPSSYDRGTRKLRVKRTENGLIGIPKLSAIETLPYEIFEQIAKELPPLWQTSLLCSSPELWHLFKASFFTTAEHKAALHEFFGFYDPGIVSCSQCQKIRTWVTNGYGSRCGHSMGRAFPNGYSLYSRKRRHLCVQQSILVGLQPGFWISFLQYRVMLKNLLLHPNPGFRPDADAGIGMDEGLRNARSVEFQAHNGGLCVKATAYNMMYPDSFGLDEDGYFSTGCELNRWVVHHSCKGKTHQEQEYNFLYRDLNKLVNQLFISVYGTTHSTKMALYRCDWCASEIWLSVTSPSSPAPTQQDDWKDRRLLRGNDPARYIISSEEYTWLGAAMQPIQLPINQFGPHAGLSNSELASFKCMKDCFDGAQSPRLHKDLPCVTEPSTWRDWKEQGKNAPEGFQCRNSHWDRCSSTSFARSSVGSDFLGTRCRCFYPDYDGRDGCGVTCFRRCTEPHLDFLKNKPETDGETAHPSGSVGLDEVDSTTS